MPFEAPDDDQGSLWGAASWYRRELESHVQPGECGAWYGVEPEVRLCRDRAVLPGEHKGGELRLFCRTCGRDRTATVTLDPAERLTLAQMGLFDEGSQLPLPFATYHAPEGRYASAECVRGFAASSCAHHRPENMKKAVRAETCGLQRCESSWRTNAIERARDGWNGTTDREGQAAEDERRALRHFGSVPWAVVVWTLPEELRSQCTGDRLRAFRRAAADMTLEVLRALVSDQRSRWYLQSWLHPCGEPRPPPATKGEAEELPAEDELIYAPHENLIVPLACLDGAGVVRRARRLLPFEWLGANGWVCDRWRDRLVEIFGPWWKGESAPAVVWHWQYRADQRGKAFALKYFARPFSRWARHPMVPGRPRTLGLKHAKRRTDLHELLDQLHEAPLPEWGSCAPCIEAGQQAEMVFASGATAEEARAELERRLDAHSCERCAGAPYLEHRRIINGPGMPGATVALATPPQTAPPRSPALPSRTGLDPKAPEATRATGGAAPAGGGSAGAPVASPACSATALEVAEILAFVGSAAAPDPLRGRLWYDPEARRYLHAQQLSDAAEYLELCPVEVARLERRRLRARERADRALVASATAH